MPATADKQYVVTSGSLGGQFNQGQILPADAFPEERMKHFIARGAIKVATEEDIAKANAVPVGLAAVGSTDQAAGTPLALFEEEKGRRDAEIEALERRIEELEAARDRDLPKMEEDAKLQEEAMGEVGLLPLGTDTGHSGASSTATNMAESGATQGGGEPSEPVDPAKQTDESLATERATPRPASTTIRGRSSS